MTDNNSIPDTQEPASKVSLATLSQKGDRPIKYIGIPNFRKPRKQNKEATERQITNRVPRGFNLRWPTRRSYRILLTSMSDTSVMIDTVVRAESLRGLMLLVVDTIGRENRRRMIDHFSITLSLTKESRELHEESIPVLEGRTLPATEPRLTNNNPIDKELEL